MTGFALVEYSFAFFNICRIGKTKRNYCYNCGSGECRHELFHGMFQTFIGSDLDVSIAYRKVNRRYHQIARLRYQTLVTVE